MQQRGTISIEHLFRWSVFADTLHSSERKTEDSCFKIREIFYTNHNNIVDVSLCESYILNMK